MLAIFINVVGPVALGALIGWTWGRVYNYMFAARFNNRSQDVAGLVLLSTAMALGALPISLWTVM